MTTYTIGPDPVRIHLPRHAVITVTAGADVYLEPWGTKIRSGQPYTHDAPRARYDPRNAPRGIVDDASVSTWPTAHTLGGTATVTVVEPCNTGPAVGSDAWLAEWSAPDNRERLVRGLVGQLDPQWTDLGDGVVQVDILWPDGDALGNGGTEGTLTVSALQEYAFTYADRTATWRAPTRDANGVPISWPTAPTIS